jgi:catechol 2,3-dioxygenase-like lactoylglutathione lyase family enzyme
MGSDLGFNGGLTCAMQCRDLDKAVAWYTNVLGFEVDYKLDDLGWSELKSPAPGVTVGLSQVEKPEVKGGATLTWGVKDIDAARKALESRDVRFDGDTVTIPDMVKLATFYDPDGNKLMFYQTLKS